MPPKVLARAARCRTSVPAAPGKCVARRTARVKALGELCCYASREGHIATVTFHGLPVVTVKPASFKRCIANLVSNAARHARTVAITGHRDHRYLTVTVDDDGPGIP